MHEREADDHLKIVHVKNSGMRPSKLSQPCEGPHQVVQVCNNGTVKIQRGAHREIMSVARIAQFYKNNFTQA